MMKRGAPIPPSFFSAQWQYVGADENHRGDVFTMVPAVGSEGVFSRKSAKVRGITTRNFAVALIGQDSAWAGSYRQFEEEFQPVTG